MSLKELFSESELVLLQQRANRVAAPLQTEHSSDTLTALMVVLGNETFALPIDQIRLVYREVAIIPLPCVPKYIAGIANLRGHLITILDLATLLGLESEADKTSATLVIADGQNATVGFCIASVGEVIELSTSVMNPIPSELSMAHPEYLQGIFTTGIALLNINIILEDPRLIVDELTG